MNTAVGSLVLRAAIRLLQPLLLMFSLFLLLTGHHEPGGGFVGGLVAAASFALLIFAYGVEQARGSLGMEPRWLVAGGLLVSTASGLWPLIAGRPWLTAGWGKMRLPGLGLVELGTPLLFDLGVYLLVLGVSLWVTFALAEER